MGVGCPVPVEAREGVVSLYCGPSVKQSSCRAFQWTSHLITRNATSQDAHFLNVFYWSSPAFHPLTVPITCLTVLAATLFIFTYWFQAAEVPLLFCYSAGLNVHLQQRFDVSNAVFVFLMTEGQNSKRVNSYFHWRSVQRHVYLMPFKASATFFVWEIVSHLAQLSNATFINDWKRNTYKSELVSTTNLFKQIQWL